MSRQSRNREKDRVQRKQKMFRYMAGLLALTVLVAAAFLLPQIIFRVQDDILCGRTTLGQRESMNVEALRTDYEKSLSARLINFAEGLQAGEDFYVTAQELTVNQEVREYLYSGSGLYQEFMLNFMETGLLSLDIWSGEFTVNQWKQYVIYSDNYARGVNFILWYIELQDGEEVTLKLLVDGEDGTIYAMKTENNLLIRDKSDEYWNLIHEHLGDKYVAYEFQVLLSDYYGLAAEEPERDKIKTGRGIAAGQVSIIESGLTETEEMDVDAEIVQQENDGWYYVEGETRLVLKLPCGESELEAVLEIEEPAKETQYIYSIPDVTIGISGIYEMIPEFAGAS